jgi:hypothetical protein
VAELDFNELFRISDVISPELQEVPGVTGVGVQLEGLTVYLDQDSEQLRGRVTQIMKARGLTTPVHFEVSGRFRAASQ